MASRIRMAAWLPIAFLLMPPAATAAAEKTAHPSEFILIVQILLLIAVGRGLGEIMQRIGQPSGGRRTPRWSYSWPVAVRLALVGGSKCNFSRCARYRQASGACSPIRS